MSDYYGPGGGGGGGGFGRDGGQHRYFERGGGRGGGRGYHGGGRFDRGRDPDRLGRSGGPDHRSRSRDRNDRGQRQPDRPLHEHTLNIRANLYSLEFLEDKRMTWYQYHVQIQAARRFRKRDDKGELVQDEKGNQVYEYRTSSRPRYMMREHDKDDKDEDDDDTALTRRIMMHLRRQFWEEKELLLLTDGTSVAFAPVLLFTDEISTPSTTTNYYGPSDESEEVSTQQPQQVLPYKDFNVTVPAECDEDDENARCSRQRDFVVRLSRVKEPVYFEVVENMIKCDIAKIPHISQVVHLAVRMTFQENLKAFGKSPRFFSFKSSMHRDSVANRILENVRNHPIFRGSNNPVIVPLLDLSCAARITNKLEVFLSADFGMSCAYPGGEKVLYVNESTGRASIAGIQLSQGPNQVIENERERKDIESVLRRMELQVSFTSQKTGKKFEKRSKLLRSAELGGVSIVWNPADYKFEKEARNNNEAGAEAKPSRRMTVADHFKEEHGIWMKYRNMPLLCLGFLKERKPRDKQEGDERKPVEQKTSRGTGKEGKPILYPLELVCLVFELAKDVNPEKKTEASLAFNNMKPQQRLRKLTELLASDQDHCFKTNLGFRSNLDGVLEWLNLRLHKEPVQLVAKVLALPRLAFKAPSPNVLRDAKWNLANTIFERPAEILSFAVVDLTGQGDRNTDISQLLPAVMDTCKKHGIVLPETYSPHEAFERVTYRSRTPLSTTNSSEAQVQMRDAISGAIHLAKNFFLGKSDRESDFFGSQGNPRFFKSVARYPEPNVLNWCLVLPTKPSSEKVGLVLQRTVDPVTHVVEYQGTSNEARMMYRIEVNHRTDYIDPFDVTYENGFKVCSVALDPSANVSLVFRVLPDGPTYSGSEDGIRIAIKHRVHNSQVECPSIIFIYIPDKKTEPYYLAKFYAEYGFGVQSQVLVRKTRSNQKSLPQYLSNIALKLNTKLASKLNEAHAWRLCDGGLKWLDEEPTLVVGLATASAQGQMDTMVVVGSALLGTDGMRMCHESCTQKKSPIISTMVINHIIKGLIVQYVNHTGKNPFRVVVYRAGVHDGKFMDIVSQELPAIRTAYAELLKEQPGYDTGDVCGICHGDNCFHCTARVTIVVAQTQHNIRLVPEEGNGNVPTGTCVDSSQITSCLGNDIQEHWVKDFQGRALALLREETSESPFALYEANDESRFDFLLVPHKGTLGTSKPVYYRVVWNENLIYQSSDRCSPLDKDTLQKLTYLMGFAYGRATCVPRLVPVLQYSSGLAQVILGYAEKIVWSQQDQDNEFDFDEGDHEQIGARIRRSSRADSRILKYHSSYSITQEGNFELQIPFRTHLAT